MIHLLIIRKYLVALFLLSSIGLLVELFLLGHYEDSWQLVPIALLVVSILVAVMEMIQRGGSPNRLLTYLSYALILAGLTGIVLHYRGNQAFELEMYPDLNGWELIGKTLTGATPALSPASLVMLGFIGWIYALIPLEKDKII